MARAMKQPAGPEGEKMVEIRIPPSKNPSDNRPVYVRVNGRTWGIPVGQRVQVPECVEEVLATSEEMQMEALKYTAAMSV